jgi:hypothetical protein
MSAVSCANTLLVHDTLHTAAVAAAEVPKNCRREIAIVSSFLSRRNEFISCKGAKSQVKEWERGRRGENRQ